LFGRRGTEVSQGRSPPPRRAHDSCRQHRARRGRRSNREERERRTSGPAPAVEDRTFIRGAGTATVAAKATRQREESVLERQCWHVVVGGKSRQAARERKHRGGRDSAPASDPGAREGPTAQQSPDRALGDAQLAGRLANRHPFRGHERRLATVSRPVKTWQRRDRRGGWSPLMPAGLDKRATLIRS
jgi:hypothetical protein